MRFLADESCDFAVVRVLRSAGHDVLAVAEMAAGSNDTTVMDIAVREERLLLTEDKDFGRLVYAHSRQSSGVIFIRYPALARKTLPKAVTAFISSKTQADLSASFTVMSPGRVRIGGRVR